MTLYHCRVEFGLVVNPQNTLNDQELRDMLRQIRLEYPSLGEATIAGIVRSRGYFVTRVRIRDTIRQSDPLILHYNGIQLLSEEVIQFHNQMHIGTYVR